MQKPYKMGKSIIRNVFIKSHDNIINETLQVFLKMKFAKNVQNFKTKSCFHNIAYQLRSK